MKWFRHENTFNNPKITLLKTRHGAVGYGIYFSILELISEHIEPTNESEWGYLPVTYTKFLEVLARHLYVDAETLNAVLATCYEVDLLENRDGRIYCDQILERCDRYTELLMKQKEQKSKEAEQKKEQSSHKKEKTVHKMVEEVHKNVESVPIIEENKKRTEKEQKRKENIKKKNDDAYKNFCQLIDFWNATYKKTYKPIDEVFKNFLYWHEQYTVEEMETGIKNIPLHEYWRDKMTPIMYFRRKGQDQQAVDRIGDLLNVHREPEEVLIDTAPPSHIQERDIYFAAKREQLEREKAKEVYAGT
jgi:hypothetical protein